MVEPPAQIVFFLQKKKPAEFPEESEEEIMGLKVFFMVDQVEGAHLIHKEVNLDPSLGGLFQGVQDFFSYGIIFENIGLEMDGILGGTDQFDHPFIIIRSREQKIDPVIFPDHRAMEIIHR